MSPPLNKVFEIFGKKYSKWIRLEKTKDLLIELKSCPPHVEGSFFT